MKKEEIDFDEYLTSICNKISGDLGLKIEEIDNYPNQKTGALESVYKISSKDKEVNEINEELNGEWLCSGLETLTNQLIGYERYNVLLHAIAINEAEN